MQKKRVIAAVINDLITDQRMIRICTSLSQAGYEVELIGRRLQETESPARPYAQRRMRFIINSGPLFYLIYNIRLFFYLLFKPFDVVHAVDLDTLPACYLAAYLKSAKVVYDAHEYFTEVPELVNRPFVQFIWKTTEQALVPRVDKAMTVSPGIAARFKEEYQFNFHLIRNAPSLRNTEQEPKALNLPPFILYQGALNKGRGLELLIGIMDQLDLDLVIVGGGDLEEELQALAAESTASNRIHFLGIKTPEELRSISSQAFIGYNVSEPMGFSYLYSLNNKFFDYIHAGLPAITNDFPEYRHLIEQYECSLLCNHNSHDILKNLKLLRNDTEQYQKLKKNCFLAKQDLNWEEEERKLLAVYEALF